MRATVIRHSLSRISPSEIISLRTALGETQEQFGRRFNRCLKTVFYWEANMRRPDPFVITAMRRLQAQVM